MTAKILFQDRHSPLGLFTLKIRPGYVVEVTTFTIKLR